MSSCSWQNKQHIDYISMFIPLDPLTTSKNFFIFGCHCFRGSDDRSIVTAFSQICGWQVAPLIRDRLLPSCEKFSRPQSKPTVICGRGRKERDNDDVNRNENKQWYCFKRREVNIDFLHLAWGFNLVSQNRNHLIIEHTILFYCWQNTRRGNVIYIYKENYREKSI